MYDERDVSVIILSDRNATVAQVTLENGPEYVASATGSSKREPGDRHDPDIAADLAVGRALTSLGREITRRGEHAVMRANPVETNAYCVAGVAAQADTSVKKRSLVSSVIAYLRGQNLGGTLNGRSRHRYRRVD